MHIRYGLGALIFAAAFALSANCASAAVPSCYASARVSAPSRDIDTEVFVLIDQTVTFDANLRQSLIDNVLGLVAPGNAFKVFSFSAFNQNRYMKLVADGYLEPQLTQAQRDATGVNTLSRLNGCLYRQSEYGRRLAARAIVASLRDSSTKLEKSDIIASLRSVSSVVAASSAHHKIVILASDMLENSAITSFYQHNSLRRVDPDAELSRVANNRMFGNFSGARVFVIGAGVLPSSSGSETQLTNLSYRDPLLMNALRLFWNGFFAKSHARLVDFGSPALMQRVQ